jgi:hypothetical protein
MPHFLFRNAGDMPLLGELIEPFLAIWSLGATYAGQLGWLHADADVGVHLLLLERPIAMVADEGHHSKVVYLLFLQLAFNYCDSNWLYQFDS